MTRSGEDVSRRDFLARMGGVLIAPGLLGTLPQRVPSSIPIATQMWVVRNEAKRDLPGVLRSLARIGYQGVEFADDYFGHSPTAIRQMLDDNGLRATGNHIYLEGLLPENLARTVELNETLGVRNLIVRSLRRELSGSREGILRFAGMLNDAAERLEPYAMRTGFHNHGEMFNRYDGELAWNILADNTRADVILQLDTGNAMHSGLPVDLAGLIRRNAGRTDTVHIKPFSKADPKAYLGRDELDWKSLIRLMETVGGTEWYIIEYEVEGPPPLEALAQNLALFKQLVAEA